MISSIYRRVDGTVHHDLSPEELCRALADEQGLLWVDLEAAGADEAHLLSSVFHFHRLAIDDCLNTFVDPPKIDDYGSYLFVIVQGIKVDGPSHRLETTELDLFLSRNYVVSFHQAPFLSITALRERCRAESSPAIERGPDFLAHQLIDGLVDDFHPVVQRLDEITDLLEERVLTRPDPQLLQQVLMLKRDTLRLRRTLLPQRDVVNRLSRGEFPQFIRQDVQIFYRDIYDHVVRITEMVEVNRDLVEGVLTTYLSVVSNRLNEVMKLLGAVGTIILLPTLIAGIYGMNFDFMPELHWRFGYPFALMLMVSVAIGLFIYFRRRGWL